MELILKWHLYAIVCFSLTFRSIEPAAIAKDQYTMDVRSDCVAAGFYDLPRDQTTYVNARSSGGLNQQLICYLQFNPQTDGDTLKMWLDSGAYIGDCDVSLEMQMSDNKYVFGCQSTTSSIPTYQVVNGKASLRLIRKSFGDTDYNFRVGITATRSLAPATAGDSSSGNIGMIVGIVIGIIVAIVIAIIVCVCCYRKRHNNASNDRGLLNKDPMTASSTCTFENSAASEKKLLGNDGVEYEVENKFKPKSALERFGPAPSKIQNDNSINRKETEENEKVVNVSRVNPQVLNKVNQPNLNKVNPPMSNKDKNEILEKSQNVPKPPPISDMLSRQSSSVATSSSETLGGQNNGTLFAALRNNPKFRKSFRENEDDAEDRARRVSSYTSTSSMASDTSKPQQPLIKPTSEPKKPQIAPVPKPRPRPASPERLGEIAGIHRPRLSSSTSESSKFENDPIPKTNQMKSKEVPKHEKKKAPRDAQSSDSESSQTNRGGKHRHKSPDRDKEPKRHHRDVRHSKKNYRSSDSEETEDRDGKSKHRNRSEDRNRDTKTRQHDDKPSRRHNSKDDYSSESEASDLYGERSKSKRNRERDVKDSKRKQDPEELSERGNREKREKERDYERKFIKSTGVRKSKGKGTHRMNRSKSTGSALEELESNYSASKSAGSVKSLNLNFVDEDIDLDSNLQPFKRAGSKTSLYASRTSLYGRRRKNSMGETMSLSSYMYDDVESRMSDFDRASISQKDKARMFKSTGDLEMKLQNSVIVRDCSTWTGSTKGVDVFDRKTFTRRKPDKRYNRGTQTSSHRERKNSLASEASAHSTHRLKSRSKSQESLSSNRKNKTDKRDRNKSPHHSKSDLRSRSRSRGKSTDSDSTTYTIDTSDSGTTFQSSGKPKLKPKPKMRKTEDDGELQQHDYETVTPVPVAYMQPPVHPQFMPINYQVPVYPPMPPPNVVAFQKPSIPPKPNQASANNSSKWDQLVNLTEGMKKRRHQMGESINETESVLSSAWSEFTPYGGKAQVFYAPANDPNRTYSTSYPDSSGQYPQHGYYNGPPESDI